MSSAAPPDDDADRSLEQPLERSPERPIERPPEQSLEQPLELTDQELDQISGGIDLMFSSTLFEQVDEFSAQAFDSDCGSMESVSSSSRTAFSSLQFFGSGFESVGDALKFVSGLMRLFGR